MDNQDEPLYIFKTKIEFSLVLILLIFIFFTGYIGIKTNSTSIILIFIIAAIFLTLEKRGKIIINKNSIQIDRILFFSTESDIYNFSEIKEIKGVLPRNQFPGGIVIKQKDKEILHKISGLTTKDFQNQTKIFKKLGVKFSFGSLKKIS
ncbi:MAG: hypothetical protein ACWA41_12355 [Putridiphycobacter sp.]